MPDRIKRPVTDESFTRCTVTVVMVLIAALAFVFSFGNVWALALRLGVPAPIAPLVAPMVDLSVVGLLIGLRYLSLRGVPESELADATRLMHLCGGLTLALNVADPLMMGLYGKAAIDAVAPVLLLGWGKVGPQFLRHFHTAPPAALQGDDDPVPPVFVASEDSPSVVQASAPVAPRPNGGLEPPSGLVHAAQRLAREHHSRTGEPIDVATLKQKLGLPLDLVHAVAARLDGTESAH